MAAPSLPSPAFVRDAMLAKLAEFDLYAGMCLMQMEHDPETAEKLTMLTRQVQQLQKDLAALLPAGAIPSERSGKSRPSRERPLSLRYDGVEITRLPFPKGSAIRSLGYQPERQQMDVEFRAGKIYRYYSVPAEVYERLEARQEQAMSLFSRSVRNVYEYKEITGSQAE